MTAHLQLVSPSNENQTVRPRRQLPQPPHQSRNTPARVPDRPPRSKRSSGPRARAATVIETRLDPHRLPAWASGNRALRLEWSQVEFSRSASLHVRRAKNGKPSVHPLRGDEVMALRELQRQFPDSGYVFATERGGPFTPGAANRLIKRKGKQAGFDFPVHCHMLRHGCGYALANAGDDTRAIQDWLAPFDPAHRAIRRAIHMRFKDLLAYDQRARLFRASAYLRDRCSTRVSPAPFRPEMISVTPLFECVLIAVGTGSSALLLTALLLTARQ
jgi:integrase